MVARHSTDKFQNSLHELIIARWDHTPEPLKPRVSCKRALRDMVTQWGSSWNKSKKANQCDCVAPFVKMSCAGQARKYLLCDLLWLFPSNLTAPICLTTRKECFKYWGSKIVITSNVYILLEIIEKDSSTAQKKQTSTYALLTSCRYEVFHEILL